MSVFGIKLGGRLLAFVGAFVIVGGLVAIALQLFFLIHDEWDAWPPFTPSAVARERAAAAEPEPAVVFSEDDRRTLWSISRRLDALELAAVRNQSNIERLNADVLDQHRDIYGALLDVIEYLAGLEDSFGRSR